MIYSNYFSHGALYSSYLPSFGGAYSSGAYAGAFYLIVSTSDVISLNYIGSRLMFL